MFQQISYKKNITQDQLLKEERTFLNRKFEYLLQIVRTYLKRLSADLRDIQNYFTILISFFTLSIYFAV